MMIILTEKDHTQIKFNSNSIDFLSLYFIYKIFGKTFSCVFSEVLTEQHSRLTHSHVEIKESPERDQIRYIFFSRLGGREKIVCVRIS